ncbi:MAG: NfeD family protein [Erysipelothrix sp.]|nr:NfeD family protein [Erysipelothrix sp.]
MEQWIWVIILVGTLIVEVVTFGNLISVWFSIGALAAYFAYIFGLSFPIQLTVFIVVSILSLLAVRPLAANYFRGNIVATNADRIIGQHTTLVKAVKSNEWGEVNVYGTVWSVAELNNRTLEKGTVVEVVAIEGAKLIVKKVD